MRLQYHQKTYDLLTQTPIDSQPAIDNFYKYAEHASSDQVEYDFAQIAWVNIDLYQRPVRFSEKNIEALNTIEAEYGVKLPEAVREWYSLDICPEIMSFSVMSFAFTPIKRFAPLATMPFCKKAPLNLWFFLHDEYIDQGGEEIVFALDEGDNPPVYAYHYASPVLLAPTFSEFIYLRFWDRLTVDQFKHVVSIWEDPEYPIDKRFYFSVQNLRANYTMLSEIFRWRFYNEHIRINIFRQGDSEQILDGHFRTDSLTALDEMLQTVWHDSIIPYFQLDSWVGTPHPDVEEYLHIKKQEMMLNTLKLHADWISEVDLANQLGNRFPKFSLDMSKCMQNLITEGLAEAHPDNEGKDKTHQLYRAK